MNSCAAISELEAPSPARRAISVSCAVRASAVSMVRCRACPAVARQLDARPFGERRGADRVEDLVRAGELVAGVAPAPLAAQPLAVEKAGAGQVHPQASAAEAVDRLAVQVLGGCPVADQRPRAGLGT